VSHVDQATSLFLVAAGYSNLAECERYEVCQLDSRSNLSHRPPGGLLGIIQLTQAQVYASDKCSNTNQKVIHAELATQLLGFDRVLQCWTVVSGFHLI
jgi:hypothetical protein